MEPRLHEVVVRLREAHGAPAAPPPATAFALVLWEKVAYLATDERRAQAFALLRDRVGLTPEAILAATPAVLLEVAAVGGKVGVAERVQHMQDAAALVAEEFGGDLDSVLTLPLRDAKRALQRIYGVGEPGAEKILLLMHARRVLALDSNGARTLVRLGYGKDDRNYAAMYRSVRASVEAELGAADGELSVDASWLADAHQLLRTHGQNVCKTSEPHCERCAVRAWCVYGRRGGPA